MSKTTVNVNTLQEYVDHLNQNYSGLGYRGLIQDLSRLEDKPILSALSLTADFVSQLHCDARIRILIQAIVAKGLRDFGNELISERKGPL